MAEITEQEQELFEAYQKLGTPQEITDSIGERDTMKRSAGITEAAKLSGYKMSVLDKLAKGMDVYVDNGKAFIKVDEVETALTEFAEENWADFLPSLKQEEDKLPHVPYISQTATEREAGTKNVGKKVANNYILQRYGSVLKAESV